MCVSDHEIADVERFSDVRSAIDDSGDGLRREFGETGMAIREKLREMELWGRDNYLQKTSFYKATEKISDDIQRLADKIDQQTERDNRVDRLRDAQD